MKHYIQKNNKEVNPKIDHYLQEVIPVIVPKEWGYEKKIINRDHCVKIMELKPGYQVSMHWHPEKEETFILIKGGLVLETIAPDGSKYRTELTEPFQSFTLCTNVPHTFYCSDGQSDETIFIEASTKDKEDDSYRFCESGKRTTSNR